MSKRLLWNENTSMECERVNLFFYKLHKLDNCETKYKCRALLFHKAIVNIKLLLCLTFTDNANFTTSDTSEV